MLKQQFITAVCSLHCKQSNFTSELHKLIVCILCILLGHFSSSSSHMESRAWAWWVAKFQVNLLRKFIQPASSVCLRLRAFHYFNCFISECTKPIHFLKTKQTPPKPLQYLLQNLYLSSLREEILRTSCVFIFYLPVFLSHNPSEINDSSSSTRIIGGLLKLCLHLNLRVVFFWLPQ